MSLFMRFKFLNTVPHMLLQRHYCIQKAQGIYSTSLVVGDKGKEILKAFLRLKKIIY